MTTMMRWDPFQDLRSAQDEMAQMSPMLAHTLGLHTQQGNARTTTTAWAPAVDISERKDAYLVTVELPGLKPEDLDITMERRYGAFRRSITLPAHVMAEGIQASFEDGVLQILVPKAEEAKPKRIQVRPGRTEVTVASSEDATPS
jgi:HSP20 family protein